MVGGALFYLCAIGRMKTLVVLRSLYKFVVKFAGFHFKLVLFYKVICRNACGGAMGLVMA
jgi:hypothetical protein